MNTIKCLMAFFAVLLSACSAEKYEIPPSITVKNPTGGGAVVQRVAIPVSNTYQGWYLKGAPSEWVEDTNSQSVLYASITINPGEEKVFELTPEAPLLADRAHAELSVRTGGEWVDTTYVADNYRFSEVAEFTSPAQLTDHSYYLKYEGPGWENDKMGYRLYLDWRNAIDVFAKSTSEIVLPEVGQDGYDSYHKLSDWGGDALKVGKSLGLGALGRLKDGNVLHFQHVDSTAWTLRENTALTAAFDVSYGNWRTAEIATDGVDLTTSYRINSGDASTRISVEVSHPIDSLVTGLVAHEEMEKLIFEDGRWGVLATWGEQSVLSENDVLGLALFYQRDQVTAISKGAFDHVVAFKPTTSVAYEIMAFWPSAEEVLNPRKAFEAKLRDKLRALNHKLEVR